MRIERIETLRDPRLEDYVGLTDVALRRRLDPERGLYLAESSTVLERALLAGHQPRSALVPERWLADATALLADFDVPVFVGTDAELEGVTGFHLHRGVMASMHRPELPPVHDVIRDARCLVVLEDVVDHTNVGAVFRSVAGLGADGVLVMPRCADPLYRRSVRVSMGTVLQVPWTRTGDWSELAPQLRAAGFSIAALALTAQSVTLDEYLDELPGRVALAFGGEGHGLSRAALAAADSVVRIPMSHGVDSLNVAASSAVTLWAVTHAQRRHHPEGAGS